MAGRRLTRQEMFDLVWSAPMTKVAEQFGISDVALKKVCEKHRVPTPARGYWAKKAAGKKVKAATFRDTADHALNAIEITGGWNKLPDAVRAVLDTERERKKSAQKPEPPTDAPERQPFQAPHPAIAATVKALRKAKPDKTGAVAAIGPGLCGITVSAACVERAIRILDQLARALAARDLEPVPAEKAMNVSSADGSLKLFLVERLEWRPYAPTEAERIAEVKRKQENLRTYGSTSWIFGSRVYPEKVQVRTGQLGIEIEDQYIRGARRSWRDGKTQVLDSMIDDVAIGVVAYLAGIKAQRDERARRERRWQYEATLRSVQQRKDEREEKRAAFVKKVGNLAAEVRELRLFLEAMRTLRSGGSGSSFSRMVTWAEQRLSHLEGGLTSEGIDEALVAEALFPEIDPLVDPPPPED